MLTIDNLSDCTWRLYLMFTDTNSLFDDVQQVFPNSVIDDIKTLTQDALEDSI